MRALMLSVLVLLIIVVGWGVGVEPRLIDEKHWRVELYDLPPEWQHQTVAVIADLQVGMPLANTGTIERIVGRLVAQRPALVLIAGDFIYHPLGEEGGSTQRTEIGEQDRARARKVIEEAVALVRPLPEAGIPTFAVLGNHDYGMQNRRAARMDWIAEDLAQSLGHAGIRVLRNEAVAVAAPGLRVAPAEADFYVVGIDSHHAGYDRPAQAFADVPANAPRLVVLHHPASFQTIAPGAAPLAVAGHTHGGQIRIPGLPEWSWMSLLSPDEVHADGWSDGFGAPGNALYVNRGIGFSVVPLRIAAMPEITWFELYAAADPE